MENHHKRALDRLMNDFTDDLEPCDIMRDLLSNHILSDDDYEKINQRNYTRRDRAFLFVPLLQRKGPNAFTEFTKALKEREAYRHLGGKLEIEAELLKTQQESDIKDNDEFSSNEMKNYHRATLNKCMDELSNNLDVDDIMSHMITKEIMTHDDRERLEKFSKRVEKVDAFLSILRRRGGGAFEVFVEALRRKPFYDGLVSTLNMHCNSCKEQMEEGIEDLLNVSKHGETFDFILFKLAVADNIQRRDALNLCSAFGLDGKSIERSKHPSLSVIALLCKEKILVQNNLQPFKEASDKLHLENVKLLVEEYNALTERGVEIKVAVKPHLNPSSTLGIDAVKRHLESMKNNIKFFEIGRRLRTLFRMEFGVRYQRLELNSMTLYLVVSTTQSLIKLSSEIDDGKVAKALGPVLFLKEDMKSLLSDENLNVTLQVTLERGCYQKAVEMLDKLDMEKSKDESSVAGDIDQEVFHRFLEKIGIREGFKKKLTVEEGLSVKSLARSTCCDMFLRDVPLMCHRSGLSDNENGQRSNMRDIIYAVLKCSDSSMRQKIVTSIISTKMAVPVLLSGVAGSNPELLQCVPPLINAAKDEEGTRESNSFFSNLTISVLRIGETRLSKSMFLNTLLQVLQKRTTHSAFLMRNTTYPRPLFSQGCVEVLTLKTTETGNRHDFRDSINFLNLRGDCTKFKAQTKFVCKLSNFVIAVIEQPFVSKHQSTVNEIKTRSQNAIFLEINQNDTFPAHQKNHSLERRRESIVVNVIQLDVLCDEIYEEIRKCCDQERTTEDYTQQEVVRYCKTIGIDVNGDDAQQDFDSENYIFMNLLDIERQQELEYNPDILNRQVPANFDKFVAQVSKDVNRETESISKIKSLELSSKTIDRHYKHKEQLMFLTRNYVDLSKAINESETAASQDLVAVAMEAQVSRDVSKETESILKIKPIEMSLLTTDLDEKETKELKILGQIVEFLKVKDKQESPLSKDYVATVKEVIKEDDFKTSVLVMLHRQVKESMRHLRKQSPMTKALKK
ncbi:Caspase recruitment domain-containing protein 6 [Holothuria leucospilota]|uniref:Caspase recruitment domain-containing protein 6 n=1 Tax=Holothuria leucospilota TaxID=206669 RepID=A0A9Q0YPD3_HOLLE|nr:Caspase recruitment domain-containing protein 6 [Holothuria leucospilota]